MALGALGLGGVAALPASAQQIPAPDLFDGQVACSMNVPKLPESLVGEGKGITAKIATKMTIDVGTEDAEDFGTPQGDDEHLEDILYVIPAENKNCGSAMYTQAEFDAATAGSMEAGFEVGDQKPIANDVGKDVGEGYSETLTKFMEKMKADNAEKAAQDKLDGLLKADTPNETDIATAREELVVAQAASTKADAELYAAGAGPIYMAGIAEWRAKAAVESAITAWNTAVGGVADASTALNASEVGIDNYVGLRDNTQIDALVDPDGNVILTAVRTYANVTGENAAVQDATTGDFDGNAGSGNFDAAGNLLIPKSDGDNNPATAVTPTESTFSYMSLNDRLTSVNGTVKALETLQTNNQNALLQPTIDEAVRRAKLEQAHYQAQFDAMIADTTDLTPDDDTQTVSVSSLYNAYRAAVTKRDNAGVTLETAVQTREMATAAVRDAFTSPQSFYQQLVDRRSYEKSQKDAEVTRLAGLTGDDAPSAEDTADAAKAVTDAQAALEEAEEIQASFQDLLADDSPVADLVLETLKADDVGDDGGVLVDTIDDAFDAAAEAMTTAENAETAATEAGNAVAALTAVDDPATEDDETGAVTKNTNDITTINDTLSGLTGDEGQVGQNIKDIERNTTDIKTNTDNIATNADRHRYERDRHRYERDRHRYERDRHRYERDRHRYERDRHRYERDRHRYERDRHRYERDRHRYERDRHRYERDRHRYERDRHRYERDRHRYERDGHHGQRGQYHDERDQHHDERGCHHNQRVGHHHQRGPHCDEQHVHDGKSRHDRRERVGHHGGARDGPDERCGHQHERCEHPPELREHRHAARRRGGLDGPRGHARDR